MNSSNPNANDDTSAHSELPSSPGSSSQSQSHSPSQLQAESQSHSNYLPSNFNHNSHLPSSSSSSLRAQSYGHQQGQDHEHEEFGDHQAPAVSERSTAASIPDASTNHIPPILSASPPPTIPSYPAIYTPLSMGQQAHHHGHGHKEKEKDKSSLSIVLDAPHLTLKGTGPDVEPTTLSGHVVLYLTEATSLKEITLQFRGKARIPVPANESLINNNNASITYVVCNHDWSFLESVSGTSKRHTRTLKAGKHYFPFSLSIGGSLPSSISTAALGGASVAYKLRAVAARPGFAHNLQTILPVPIQRSFTVEALEYQQTLEIENTWPDKVMYAIMLPHKAWAAGDALGAVLKFSPLSKGVKVVSVVSALYETTKVYAKSGNQEETRVVCSARHEVVEGTAVEVEVRAGMVTTGASAIRVQEERSTAQDYEAGPSDLHPREQMEQDEAEEYQNKDVVTYVKLPISPSSYTSYFSGGQTPPSSSASSFTPPHSATTSTSNVAGPSSGGSTAPVSPSPPVIVTPSHTLEPITVSHRVRWSIYIRNRDGHISELRCSLPVVILDGRLKEEARDASLMSRRMMARTCGIVPLSGDEELWGLGGAEGAGADREGEEGGEGEQGGGGRQHVPVEGDRELPSYNAHVRDRVANMFLPEAATVRVSNPWVGRIRTRGANTGSNGEAPVAPAPLSTGPMAPCLQVDVVDSPVAASRDEMQTQNVFANYSPTHAHPMAHLPHVPPGPETGASTPLDFLNSELLLSLSDDPIRRFGGGGAAQPPQPPPPPPGAPGSAAAGAGIAGADGALTPAGVRTPPQPPVPLQFVSPGPGSRPTSRPGSRWGSRPPSPDRSALDVARRRSGDSGPGEQHVSRPGSPGLGASAGHPAPGPASVGYVYEPLPSVPVDAPALLPGAAHHEHEHGHGSHGHGAGHGHGHGIRNLGSLFKATMKPFTALSLGGHKHQHRHDGDHHQDHHHDSSGWNSENHSPTSTGLADDVHPHSTDPFVAGDRSPGWRDSHPPISDSEATPRIPHHAMTLPTSMSTSELTAMRRANVASPYTHPSVGAPSAAASSSSSAQVNAHTSTHPLAPPPPQPLSGPALLHRAFTEVPDYAIASRGFLGGVPPLTSMRGLPSYDEAVARSNAHTKNPLSSGTDVPAPSDSTGPSVVDPYNQSQNPSPNTSLTRSEPDLAGLFARASQAAEPVAADPELRPAPVEEQGTGIVQRLERAVAEGDGHGGQEEEADEGEEGKGIEMRSRATCTIALTR